MLLYCYRLFFVVNLDIHTYRYTQTHTCNLPLVALAQFRPSPAVAAPSVHVSPSPLANKKGVIGARVLIGNLGPFSSTCTLSFFVHTYRRSDSCSCTYSYPVIWVVRLWYFVYSPLYRSSVTVRGDENQSCVSTLTCSGKVLSNVRTSWVELLYVW